MARNNRNRTRVRNADLYAAVYASREEAEAEDREGLLTVQAFDSGDFPVMKSLDEENWEDGEIVEVSFVVRMQKRKDETPAKRRAWKSGEAAESYPS
jgi:hypothetical protein